MELQTNRLELKSASGLDDWLTTSDTAANIADASNTITASNLLTPQLSSVTYDASLGKMVITGEGFTNYAAGLDIDVLKFTLTGEAGGTHTLSNTADVEIESYTQFTVTLSGTDKTAYSNLLNKTGNQSQSGDYYNLSVSEDWARGTPTAINIIDASTGVTVLDVAPPTVTTNKGLNIEEGNNPGVSINSFSQKNLSDGMVKYVHNNTNTSADSFIFKVSDGTNELLTQTFSISINLINDDAPILTSPEKDTLTEDQPYKYQATATDVENQKITYIFTDLPSWLSSDSTFGTPFDGNIDTSFTVIASNGLLFDTLLVNRTVIDVPETTLVYDTTFALRKDTITTDDSIYSTSSDTIVNTSTREHRFETTFVRTDSLSDNISYAFKINTTTNFSTSLINSTSDTTRINTFNHSIFKQSFSKLKRFSKHQFMDNSYRTRSTTSECRVQEHNAVLGVESSLTKRALHFNNSK